MNLSAQNFINYLNEKEVKYDVMENENDTVVTCGFQMKNTSIRVSSFVSNDNKHVAIRCFNFIKVQEDKFAPALLACNQCNVEYRWVKFILDKDLEITACDDAVISPETAGPELFELLLRMLDIVDACYPIMMEAIWSSNK